MAKRDAETRRLGRMLYREVERRGDPGLDWWVNRDVIEQDLGLAPDSLFDAAELLFEDGQVASGSSDLMILRTIHRGPSLL